MIPILARTRRGLAAARRGLGWPVVLVNLAVMAVLIPLWAKLVRFGGGRVAV